MIAAANRDHPKLQKPRASREAAGEAVADCTDWVSLMETCCSNLGDFNDEMKAAVVADLCRIASADGTVHSHEGVHVTAVASELGVAIEA
jgi:uncharacterized tellurite resistance protein B-like protein